jgi:hypothetical protein
MPRFFFDAPLTILATQLSTIALVAICGLAVWKGSVAVRLGGVLILATWSVTLIASFIAGAHHLAPIGFLISDAILAAGLLVLAVRFSSWWMGAAMLLQAVSLSFHAAYFAADKAEISFALENLYVLGKNLTSMAMLIVLLTATLVGMAKRTRRAAPAAAAQAA